MALSQYMDLTVAVPAAERGKRLPTADEVAEALRRHERNFRQDILVKALGMQPAQIPPFHVGEFGVGVGGLRHPNLWGPLGTPEQEKQRAGGDRPRATRGWSATCPSPRAAPPAAPCCG